MTIDEIRALFAQEFGALADRFTVLEIPSPNVAACTDPGVWHPGVYVWWYPGKGVMKVGRHFTNSRKRALEYLRDNTGGAMAALATDSTAKLLLFFLSAISIQ
jgi:hypothetical protein